MVILKYIYLTMLLLLLLSTSVYSKQITCTKTPDMFSKITYTLNLPDEMRLKYRELDESSDSYVILKFGKTGTIEGYCGNYTGGAIAFDTNNFVLYNEYKINDLGDCYEPFGYEFDADSILCTTNGVFNYVTFDFLDRSHVGFVFKNGDDSDQMYIDDIGLTYYDEDGKYIDDGLEFTIAVSDKYMTITLEYDFVKSIIIALITVASVFCGICLCLLFLWCNNYLCNKYNPPDTSVKPTVDIDDLIFVGPDYQCVL